MSLETSLKSFPFDSMDVLNSESGNMEPDRLYEAEIFRKYFAKFLSNGVYFGHYKNYGENGMKVIANGGLNIKVNAGAGIIEGADFENEEDKIFTLERPTSGNRVDRVVVKLDKTLAVRETKLYIKAGNGTTPASLQRDNNIYEICLAEVNVKSTSNIEASDVVDKRLDKTLCGIVNSLISIDGEDLYQQFQDYIDFVTENLVRKDQENVTITGTFQDKNGGTSKNNFTDAYKNKLDGIANNANKTTIENVLTSTSTANALSAAQGKILKGFIDEKQKNISKGTATPSGGNNGDIYIQYFN